MKTLGKITAIIILCAVVLLSIGCSSGSSSTATASTQTATVRKGNISVSVTGTGNLALAQAEDLAFEVAGTVEEVLVDEGESVTTGQELVKLDTAVWDKQLKTLEKALTTAQRSLTTRQNAIVKAESTVTAKGIALQKAESAVTTKENALAKAERQVAAKELAVRQAELNVKTAENNLSGIDEVKDAQDVVDDAEYTLKFAKSMLSGEFGGGTVLTDYSYWSQLAITAQDQLTIAKADLKEILDGDSAETTKEIELKIANYQLQIEQSQAAVVEAEAAVEDARQAVTDAQLTLDEARQAVKDAQLALAEAEQAVKDAQLDKNDAYQTVKDAQSDLDEARSLSPIITAPFDGFITKINVAGGDEILKGTVAMQLADPNKFEANIQVTEQDVFSIKVGGDASVTLDAISGLVIPAKITKIAPLATNSSGVVSYKVTVELSSLTSLKTAQPTSGAVTAPGTNSTTQTPAGNPSTAAAPSAVQNISLKSGLSAVIDIIVEQANNVLVVSNRAITRQGQNSTVQVVNGDTTETRIVKVGISNDSNTEITEGLTEGEQIVIKTSTSSTTSSSAKTSQSGIPGITGGGPPPGGF